MPRIAIPISVETTVEVEKLAPSEKTEKLIVPVKGAAVEVKKRNSSEKPVVYAAETGAGEASAVTEANGQIPGWVEEGAYTISVTGGTPTIATTLYSWDAVSASESTTLSTRITALEKSLEESTNGIAKTGDIKFSALSISSGWLPCEYGTALGTTYPALATLLGTGSGSLFGSAPTGYIRLPDFRGRAPIGVGKGESGEESETFPNRTLGQKVGALVHKLTEKQLANHNHGGSTGAAGQNVGINNPAGSIGTLDIAVGGGGQQVVTALATYGQIYPNSNHEHSIASAGSGESFNILSPSTTCYFWIKT